MREINLKLFIFVVIYNPLYGMMVKEHHGTVVLIPQYLPLSGGWATVTSCLGRKGHGGGSWVPSNQ
jgi:hypothetical protein